MPPRPFVNDGLWRCLCPSFPSHATPSVGLRVGAPPRRRLRNRLAANRISTTHDPFSVQSKSSTNTTPDTNNSPQLSPRNAFRSIPLHNGAPPLFSPSRDHHRPGPARFAHLSTQALYEAARTEGAKGNFNQVMDICRVLIKERGEARNTAMYTAVLHSLASASNGTAGKLRSVLEEMGFWEDSDTFVSGQSRIELDVRACECVLEALAVHPDYLLRQDILEYMRTRWFTLSDRARNFVVAGMLRDRHFEHALEVLEDMVRTKARVESWLFNKATWMLLEYGEVEEAFYVLSLMETCHGANRRSAGSVKLSEALRMALLDAAGRQQLYEPARKIWMEHVQTGFIKPGTGASLSVLTLAARHGDVGLATDVFRVLTEQGTTLTTHHYELLVSTYLKAHDLSSALSVLLIMVDANLRVNEGTCNPLFMHLSSEKPGEESRPMQAFKILQTYEAAGRKIPTDAVNACIQASTRLGRFEEALEIYKALHSVSHAGPNTQTFNNLFRLCHLAERKELAMYFVNEMIALNLKPDRVTYDRLILVCLLANDLEDALLYYEEMMTLASGSGNSKDRPRRKTWERLIKKCVENGDDRAVPLFEAYKKAVEDPRRDLEREIRAKFVSVRAGDKSASVGEAAREGGGVKGDSEVVRPVGS
ncbi:hypothetical protein LEMA_P116100.1 [Plenodomus lingam JN3]|uniref:Pentatricopeptide repeat-containing protein-mitochondrial domain-containing protein n=1 Tax=Leptosphaeria maculans (strain JN3 / isolate v23.1.3 / race Av1-4-5-6-7-8) TaxID=985895 RepID=E4ZTP7_LEPMJ|nr:hypothetical protein LEMA_P116100.1 [Plenodomus lingam JN3]CBX94607.1 hypothetical protein LEMA_P116100.1 [Plenodomus lingam JN3]